MVGKTVLKTDGTYWELVDGKVLINSAMSESATAPLIPFGTFQDISLSDALRALEDGDDSVVDCQPCFGDDSSTNTSDEDRKPAAKPIARHLSFPNDEKIKTIVKKRGSIYCEANPILSDTVKYVHSVEDYKYLLTGLHQLQSDMIERARARNSSHNASESEINSGSVVGPPVLSAHKRSSARTKKVTSPAKRHKPN